MNMNAPMPRTGFKFMLTVQNGPDTGATFQLLPPRVSIGRGADCNVILNDPRVSRVAARGSNRQKNRKQLTGRSMHADSKETIIRACSWCKFSAVLFL